MGSPTVAEAIADILVAEGVEFLFAYPVNPLIEPCAARGIRPIIPRQERIGVHMADALARVSSGTRPAVFGMQLGPGAENAFGAVAQAFADSVPILVIAQGYARHEMRRAPNFSAAEAYRPIVKWVEQPTRAVDVRPAMRRAFSQLRRGRPRPVLVELPWDVGIEPHEPIADWTPIRPVRTAPDPVAVEAAADAIVAAERPILYAGQGVHQARAWPALRALAERLEAPVTTSLAGKSAFPEDHPLALGAGGRALPRTVDLAVGEADLIVGIGCSFAATGYGIGWPVGPGRPRYVHATLDPADLDADVPADIPLIGDAGLVLEVLLAAVTARLPSGGRGRLADVTATIAERRAAWLADWADRRGAASIPMPPYRVLADLHAAVDLDRTIITHDAGSPRDQLSPFWTTTTPLSYLGWGKSTQLGYGLGLALGAKLARPDHLVVNVMGDAAIGMVGMDLETAVRERIPILTVVLDNAAMAIELPVMPVSTARYRSTDISGDYAALARALGAHGERVADPDELMPAIRRAIAATEAGRPALLDVQTTRELSHSLPGRTAPPA